jgi:hypothetical protein
MALPFEIRGMIYNLLLLPEHGDKIRRSQGRTEKFLIPVVTILRTCKQAYFEGLKMMYLKGHIHLFPTTTIIDHGSIDHGAIDHIPISRARNLELDFIVRRFHVSYHKSPSATALGRLLQAVITLYKEKYEAGERHPVALHINLTLWRHLPRYYGWVSSHIFDPRNTPGVGWTSLRTFIWFRVQLPVLFDEMRAELLAKAPNVTLTSNADNLEPCAITTRRVSEKEIRFSDPRPNGESGTLYMTNVKSMIVQFKHLEDGEVVYRRWLRISKPKKFMSRVDKVDSELA